MRLYVPKGASLTGSAIGVEKVDKENMTVFTWMMDTPV
jgi:hypothetical protein